VDEEDDAIPGDNATEGQSFSNALADIELNRL
jgi:hypothetical protein